MEHTLYKRERVDHFLDVSTGRYLETTTDKMPQGLTRD